MQILTVKGTWEQIGRALGEAQGRDFDRRLRSARWTVPLRRLVDAQVAFLRCHSPEAFGVMRGLSESLEQPLETVVAAACWEYIFFGEHCSTFLGQGQEGLWVAHNEDAHPSWRGLITAARCQPKGGVPFVSLQYAGTPPGMAAGMNGAGFAVVMNDMHRKKLPALVGESPCVAGLRLLQARSWKQVDRIYRSLQPNVGMHFLVADKNKARSLELYWDRKSSVEVQPGFAHTNHPLLRGTIPGSTASRSSRERMVRLSRLSDPEDGRKTLDLFRLPIARGGLRKTGTRGDDLTHVTVILVPGKQRLEILETGKRKRPVRV